MFRDVYIFRRDHRKYLILCLHGNALLGKDVIELGAGCGLGGITAAALGARSVILTDILTQQSHLEKNIELNRSSWEKVCSEINFGVLHFGDRGVMSFSGNTETSHQPNTFDVVLGADIGYDLSLHKPIYRTLVSLLHPKIDNCKMPSRATWRVPSCRIALLAEELRWGDIHQWYVDCLMGLHDIDDDDDSSRVCISDFRSANARSDCEDDENCSRKCDECYIGNHTVSKPTALNRMFQEFSTILSGESETSSHEACCMEEVDHRTKESKTPGRRKNAIHLLMLSSEILERKED